MDTLKTAIVVVLLLAVLYGVYVKLNQPDQDIPEEIAWAQDQTTAPLQVDFGGNAEGASSGVTASLGDTQSPVADQRGLEPLAHDHAASQAMPQVPEFAAAGMPQTAYGQSSEVAAASTTVSAPELIMSAGDGPSGSASRSESGGYGAENGFPPAPTANTTAMQAPPAAANTSVYAPPSNAVAPTGSYGESSGLTGNPQMVATAEPPVANAYAKGTPAPGNAAGSDFSRIDSVIQTAQGQLDQGQYYEALLTLSFAYDASGLAPEESQKLQQLLDPLSGKVIYSQEHLIGAPYQLQAGETLQSVAAKHSVPWQLLANINGLRDPAAVQPGTSIKVVPGPFHAEVDIANSSLTLFAGRLYAGRFAISVNGNKAPAPGEYQVKDKQPGHSFYAGNAQTLTPQDPQNPFGGVWIDLGGDISIHGTSSSPEQSQRHGCISLAAKDANDLYGILSLGSNVVVR